MITAFNSPAAEIWGREPKLNDPEDLYCGSFKLYAPDGSPISHERCWMARALHENREFSGREIVIERPDGKRLLVLAHATPITDGSGALVGAVNVLVDISKRKPAKDGLRPADPRSDEMLAVLAHELRNPLVSIRHAVDYLQDLPEASPQHVRRVTEIISAQVNQLTHLIDDLLDLGRIARGAYKLRKTRLDLGIAIREMVESLRPGIEAHGQALSISVPSEPILVEADTVRIAQILSNLLDNAKRYTQEGGSIAVEVRSARESAVLEVRDSGIGIPDEFLPHVFERFARSDRFEGRARGGLGLGLSITKTLVEMHGGEVSVASSGRGSTFTVRLPMASRAPDHTSTRMRHKSAPQRILIIDDNAGAADSFSMLLASMGHKATIASDGLSGVMTARKLSPQVVFIDIDLPDMDGYEVARLLRQEHTERPMLLVAATGYSGLDRRRAQQAGFDHQLTKPVRIDDLDMVLSSADRPALKLSLAD
jgi:nitrogen-specific signal transduction histidine kinase/ActR/RegA family two-component response regulator